MIETEIAKAIEARMTELRPLVDEYERLKGAELVLKDIPEAPRKPAAIIGHVPPHPEKGKRYTKGEKEAAIKWAKKKGVRESSRTYGIPEATIHRWIRKAQASAS